MKRITLANLHEATAQEVFNQVKTHLLTQMKRAHSGGKCCYRNEEGLSCAAGCLIADEEYKTEMDMDFVQGTGWKDMVLLGYFPNIHVSLISSLQNIHDNYAVDAWERELKNKAASYNLEY